MISSPIKCYKVEDVYFNNILAMGSIVSDPLLLFVRCNCHICFCYSSLVVHGTELSRVHHEMESLAARV